MNNVSQKFSSQYFDNEYGGVYERRNPRYKWRSFLRKILRFVRGGDLLEVGCGFGLFLMEAKAYFTCVGSDISEYAISQACKRLPDEVGLYSGVIDQIDFQRKFDVITCFDVLEHIADLGPTFDRLDELLHPGGLLVFTVPVYDGPIGYLVQKLDQDETHVHKESRFFWLEYLNGTSFSTVYWTGVWRYFVFKRVYLNYLSCITRRWTPAIMVIAKKKS